MRHSSRRSVYFLCAALVITSCMSRGARAGGLELPVWEPLGPDLIHNGQAWPTAEELKEDPLAGRVPVTGRINVVVPNYFNPKGDVWVGTATGGVWNGGVLPKPHWTPMTDHAPTLAVGDIALDINTCDSVRCRDVWVGTGENSIRRDTQYGRGVLKGTWDSSTGAYGWQLLGQEHFEHGNVVRVLLDPTTPAGNQKVIYAALATGQASNSTHSTVTTIPAGALGIWKSIDGGATWQRMLTPGESATDLEMDPLDPQTLYAGIRHEGIYRSQDGGLNWSPIHAGLTEEHTTKADWPEIAVTWKQGAPKSWLYAVLGPCPHPQEKEGGEAHFCSPAVVRSQDGGDSWEVRKPIDYFLDETEYGTPLTAYVSYTHALTIHPKDPETLWYGGINLYRSTNGGWGWQTVGHDKLHPDHHDVAVWTDESSSTGVRAFDVNDGGLFYGDGGEDWDGEVQQGLAVTQVLSIAVPEDESFILIGTQDNGANVRWNGPVWEHAEDGDSSWVSIDPDDPERFYDVYVGMSPRTCKGDECFQMGWDTRANDPSDGDLTNDGNGLPDYNTPFAHYSAWYPPLVPELEPFAGQTGILLGTLWLQRSGDDAETWSVAAGSPPDTFDNGGPIAELAGAWNPITAVALQDSGVFDRLLGYYDGDLLAFDHWDGITPVWLALDGDPKDNGLPDRPITSIAVSPADPDVIVVALAGVGGHGIYRTESGGTHWEPFDASYDDALAGTSVNVLLIDPKWPHRLWAGNDYGVYVHASAHSPDKDWEKTFGLPNVAVYDLERSADGERLYAATHGRGVWVTATGIGRLNLYFEDCCGYVDLYDPQPLVAVSGLGFEPLASCTASLFDGETLCGSSSLDADGAVLSTDERGFLVASKDGYYGDREGAQLCRGGLCAGGIDPGRCAVTDVEVRCGGQTVRQAVARAGEVQDPPSARLALGAPAARGLLRLAAVLTRSGAPAIELCSAEVPYGAGQAPESLLGHAAEALSGDSRCRAEGVTASVESSAAGSREDESPTPPRLRLSAERATGLGLFAEVTSSTPLAAALEGSLGLSPARRIVPRLSLAGRAVGGSVTVTERSGLGTCRRTVATRRDDTAEQVAVAIEEALLARPTGGADELGCAPDANPRDVSRLGASLFFGAARSLAVESADGGLVVTLGGSR